VHSDLKPQNILTNLNKPALFIIDFGLTLNYQGPGAKYKFKGTPYFASNNQLMKNKVGPKDDLESMFYILIYFLLGSLPWAK